MALFENKEKAMSEDALLVERAKSGDKQAFGTLVEKYQSFVYRTVLFDLKNPDDAYDVSQEVFIKAYRALERFRCDSEFSTWLYRISKNAVYDFARKSKNSKSISLSAMTEDDDGKEYDIADESEKTSPEGAYLRTERAKVVRQAISELSDEHKEIIILRDLQEMSYDEISRRLDIGEGTVKSRLSRARQALKRKLEGKNIL